MFRKISSLMIYHLVNFNDSTQSGFWVISKFTFANLHKLVHHVQFHLTLWKWKLWKIKKKITKKKKEYLKNKKSFLDYIHFSQLLKCLLLVKKEKTASIFHNLAILKKYTPYFFVSTDFIIVPKGLRGLRVKIPDSNLTMHSIRLRDQTLLWGCWWPLGSNWIVEWLPLGEWDCSLDRSPKLTMGQPNES